jgi:hypothetical protein
MTTITIIFWIFYGVYITLTHRPAVDVPAELLKDISPVLDAETLDSLPDKMFFEESDVVDFVGVISPTPQVRAWSTDTSSLDKNNNKTIVTPTP